MLFILLAFTNKMQSQFFFDSQFSNNNYNQKTIKKKGIKSLEINQYKGLEGKSIPEIMNTTYYTYYLEFNKNGDMLKKQEYAVVDSIKKMRFKQIYSYNNENQLIREEIYDYTDSIQKILSYTYTTSGRLKTKIAQNHLRDTTYQIHNEYNKESERLIYSIKHDYVNHLYNVHLFKKMSKTIEKEWVYEQNNPSLTKINDSIITNSPLLRYSITTINKKEKTTKTSEYNSNHLLLTEYLHTKQKDRSIIDRQYYDEDAELINRNKLVFNKKGMLLEFHILVRKWVSGKAFYEMQKTSYDYDSDFNIVKSITENEEEKSYVIEKDKNRNWILIKEFVTNKQRGTKNSFQNLYTQKILYY